jgi:hypothetical protein
MMLTTLEINGKDFEIEVNEMGQFYTELDGESITADGLDQLMAKLRCLVKQVDVRIPFWRWVRNSTTKQCSLRGGNITGMHASNSNILIEWNDGACEQEWGYGRYVERYMRLETEALQMEYIALQEASEQARAAVRAFEKQHEFIAGKAVEELLKATGQDW